MPPTAKEESLVIVTLPVLYESYILVIAAVP